MDSSPIGTNGAARHVSENRRYWDSMAAQWVGMGEQAWVQAEPTWGVWGVPNAHYPLLPQPYDAGALDGIDAVELGCGTGYVSRWMERLGARVVGIDNSAAQLATARRLAARHGSAVAFVHGDAEAVAMPDGSFDLAISEYGAAIWCDPHVWVPEAHRLLRPGGRLVFLGNHPLVMCCAPLDGAVCDDRLHRPWFGMHELDWTAVAVDPGGIEFNLPTSGWLALFRDTGFEVEDHREVQAPDGDPDDDDENRFFASRNWARRWPSEQVWWLRKR